MTGLAAIGITGHQHRDGADWVWVEGEIAKVFHMHLPIGRAYTCLAKGADQCFAKQALLLGIAVTAVIPLPDYQRLFKGRALTDYRNLLQQCELLSIGPQTSNEVAFEKAGRVVVDLSHLLIAVWDGEPAVGRGGTTDIVAYSLQAGRDVVHIDPIGKTRDLLRNTLN